MKYAKDYEEEARKALRFKLFIIFLLTVIAICIVFLMQGCTQFHIRQEGEICEAEYYSLWKDYQAPSGQICGAQGGANSSQQSAVSEAVLQAFVKGVTVP